MPGWCACAGECRAHAQHHRSDRAQSYRTPTLVTRAALNQSGLLFPVDLQGLGVLRVRSIFSAGVVDICHLQSAVADYSEARTIEIDGSIVHKGLEGYTEVCGV